MCFIIHPSHKEVKIASEDIICYKRFEKDTLESPYRNFRYSVDLLFKITLGLPFNNSIEQGFHSYTTLDAAIKDSNETESFAIFL